MKKRIFIEEGPIKEYHNNFKFFWDFWNGKIKYNEPVKIVEEPKEFTELADNTKRYNNTEDYFNDFKLKINGNIYCPISFKNHIIAQTLDGDRYSKLVLGYSIPACDYLKLPENIIINNKRFYKGDASGTINKNYEIIEFHLIEY